MTVERVTALCVCEGCLKSFHMDFDIGEIEDKFTEFGDVNEVAKDYARGGQADCFNYVVRATRTIDRQHLPNSPTVQGGFLLCDECSNRCDEAPIEGDLTREQVLSVLKIIDHHSEED